MVCLHYILASRILGSNMFCREIQQDFGMLAVMSKDVSQSLTDAGIDLELDDLVIGDDQYDEDYDYEEAGDYGNQTGDDEDA